MNGLGNALEGGIRVISDELRAMLSKISADLAQLQTAVNKISAEQAKQAQTLFVIDQCVNSTLRNIAKTHAPASALHG
jgi:hypothetical protein